MTTKDSSTTLAAKATPTATITTSMTTTFLSPTLVIKTTPTETMTTPMTIEATPLQLTTAFFRFLTGDSDSTKFHERVLKRTDQKNACSTLYLSLNTTTTRSNFCSETLMTVFFLSCIIQIDSVNQQQGIYAANKHP